MTTPARFWASDRGVRFALSLLVFVSAAYFVPGATWSPVSRFCLTRAIVERGSFEITDDVASTGDRAQVGDRFYTDKAPFPSMLAVPAYAASFAMAKMTGEMPAFRAVGTASRPARVVLPNAAFTRGLYVCSVSTAAVAGAGLAWLLFDVLRRRFSLSVATLGAGVTLLSTPLFPYAASFFDHTLAATFLFAAFAVTDGTSFDRSTAKRWAAVGALLALAVGSEYLAALPGAIVGGAALLMTPKGRRGAALSWILVGAAAPLLLLGAYHTMCFGAPYRTGYSFITHEAFAAGQATGLFGLTWPRPAALFGLLFGRSRGLFYVAPITALAVFALATDKHRDRAAVVGLAVLGAAYLANASYFVWDGGRALGPRHMVPALGFLGFGVALAFERYGTLAAVLAGLSSFVVLFTTAVGLEVPTRIDVISSYLVPSLRDGRIARAPGASNLGLLLGLGPRASLAALTALVAVGAFVIARLVAALAGSTSESPESRQP